MKLIPTLNAYKGSLVSFIASLRKYNAISQLFVNEDPNTFYIGNDVDKPTGLMPFQTSVKTHRITTANAQNATGVLTVAQIKLGLITSTSAAPVSATLPTATAMATALKAARGTWYEFAIDNSTGASVVTLVVGTGTTAAPAILTGANTLTVAAGSVGIFRLYFISATAALIYRVG